MKFIRPLIFFFIIASFSCTNQEILGALGKTGEVLGGEDNALTNTEVIAGLKQALSIGAENSTALTSKEDGFYKNPLIVIPFPEEAIKVKNTLMDIGFENHVNKFEMVMNRAAEEATKEAAVIFVNAITSMSIQDGFNILKGGKGAATDFLKNATRAQLVNSFSPKVETAIETVELGKYWEPLIMKYNQVNALNPFGSGDDINPNLNDYVTNRAIDGLFTMVEKEEDKIREDPAARVTDLLKKVFSQQ
ncbi:MAG: DUF4197 domain-containing protein [Flavobacteriales bacterium]|nr:DUF4197 domain-containing protein [Flavobacteriales bacterium]